MTKQLPTWLTKRRRLDCVHPTFETASAAMSEDRLRLRQLASLPLNDAQSACAVVSSDDAIDLARRLQQAMKGQPVTLASSTSMRAIRIARIGAMFELFDRYSDNDLIAFTAINVRWAFSPNELMKVSATTIRNQFRRHLVRLGDLRGPLVAFLHGEYEPIAGVYVLHFHGITLKDNRRLLNSLSGRWGYEPTSSGAAPIKCDPIRDRVKQFSYVLKSYWPERAINVSHSSMRRDRKPSRVREPFHSLGLIWLDRQSLADIQLLMNCRVGAGGRLIARECT